MRAQAQSQLWASETASVRSLYRVLVPRSHICPTCLTELARVPTVRDPHYGLPIVVCPRCTTACVRTRHPDQRFWRSVGRLRRGLTQLLLALLFTAVSVGAIIAISIWVGEFFTDRRARLRLPADLEPAQLTALIAATAMGLVCGVTIRVIYAHQRFWIGWLVLMVPAGALISIDFTLGHLVEFINRFAPTDFSLTPPAGTVVARRYQGLALMAVIDTLGMLLGTLLNRSIAQSSRKRVVKLRRKLRRRRARRD